MSTSMTTTSKLRRIITIYSTNWILTPKKNLTNRIFIGPSSVLTFLTN
jgi:hypothetical protein